MSNLPTTPGSQPPFDRIRHEDEQGEYWLARELADMLGYAKWQYFNEVIYEAKIASASQGYPVERLFTRLSKKSTGGRPSLDYRLTRFACYMVAMSADGNKSEVAAAKIYFAVRTREAELFVIERELMDLSDLLQGDPVAEAGQRIVLRQELTDANKELLRRAYEAGVITSEQFALFMNQGYRGTYDGRTEDDMHAYRGLQPNEKLSNYMGALETFVNYMRAVLGARNIRIRKVDNPHDAGVAHYDAGKAMRDVIIQLLGVAPEDLPRPTKSYKQIVKEEAARIAREEEDEHGLWGQLPPAQ